MANVYENELYGKLLPDIFIDKITLENSGFIAIEQNPHIDNIRQQTPTQQQSEATKITLNLTVKEKYKNDTVGKWLKDADFQKYVKVKIFEVEDARLSSLLSLSKDVSMALDPTTINNAKQAVINLMLGYLKMGTKDEIINLVKEKVKIYNLQIQNSFADQIDVNKKTSVETLDNGTRILNNHLKQTCEKPKSYIGHLAYYCVVYLDHLALIQDFRLQPTDDLIRFLTNTSKITGEIVFNNGEIVGQTNVYVDQDSKIWTGDVHKTENGNYRSGLTETEDSFPLIKRTISNSTIQDFRRRQQYQKINFDFNPTKKYFQKYRAKNASTNTEFLARNNSFFSNISIAIDKDRDAKMIFSVALKNILFATSQYSYLIQDRDSTLANTVARNIKIKSMKMFRQRVKVEKVIKNSVTISKNYVKFSKNEKMELLFHAKDPSLRVVDVKDKFYLRQTESVLYPEVVEYTAVDRTASLLTDGLYRYSIELEIEDPIQGFLENKIRMLNVIRDEYVQYRIESEKMSISKYFTEVSDPHIRHLKEEDMVGTILEGNYNSLTNSFTQSFINKMSEKYSNAAISPWVLCSSIYVDILALFVEEIDKSELQRELQKISSPTAGSPAGINMVINLIEHLISQISRILGKKSVIDNLSGKTTSAKSIKNFVVKHDFNNEVFDSNLENEVFIDYLEEETAQPKTGIRTISANDFRNRIEREVEKFYNSKNPDIVSSVDRGQISKTDTRNSLYSYLSPSSLIVGKETVPLRPTRDQEEKERIANTISLAKTNNKSFYKTSLYEEDLDLSIFNADMQEKFSVTISTYKVELPEDRKTDTGKDYERIPETEESKIEKIGKNSSRAIVDLREMSQDDKKGIKEFLSVFGPKANETTKIFDLEKTKEKIQETFTEQQKNGLPIQITSILSGDSNKDSNKDVLGAKTLLDINYNNSKDMTNVGSLKEIQILTGYEKGENGETLVNKPKWEKMTEDVVSNLPSNFEITCRLADFSNKDIVAEDLTKSTKIMNSTFTMVGSAPALLEEDEEMYNTNLAGKDIQVSKQMITQAIATEVQQNTFPAGLTKTIDVSSQTIEQVVNDSQVKTATENKQKEIITDNKSLPKVPASSVKSSGFTNKK